jgi:hypothetical protein
MADRLDFAEWLVDRANPLTARVTVNQIWKQLFGRGLVVTVDNFGLGGDTPSHPELLDYLADQLMQQGWSRKHLIRLIVNSATYQQASHARSELMTRDPENVLLARQSRFRLEAEMIRDAALSASGLMTKHLGGPGILPPQPAYIASISRNVEWKTSTGADLYRRGVYILFRRATPYPMLLTFDAPDSSVACTKRERSNSPLQALTLLNDPVFFECARSLGYVLAHRHQGSVEEKIEVAFERCLGRIPQPKELERLQDLYTDRIRNLAEDSSALDAFLDPQSHPHRARLVPTADGTPDKRSEEAVWVFMARVLMNLDEFITRE